MSNSLVSPDGFNAPVLLAHANQISQWKSRIPDAEICARQHYRIASIKCDVPLLILPLQGSKRLHFLSEAFDCRPGEFLMLHGAIEVGVENIPAAHDPYRAWAIAFPWRLIEIARQLILGGHSLSAVDSRLVTKGCVMEDLFDALLRHQQLLQGAPLGPEIDVGLLGILVALHSHQASGFLCSSNPSFAARIRMMVGANPQYEWSSSHVEEALHLSGATLRRRLAEEGTSLRRLIREARLQTALTLLQTQKKSIKVIAAECGYRSLASFRESFIEQFGISPTTVADH